MLDYMQWCRLCGSLETVMEIDENVLVFVYQIFEVSALDND